MGVAKVVACFAVNYRRIDDAKQASQAVACRDRANVFAYCNGPAHQRTAWVFCYLGADHMTTNFSSRRMRDAANRLGSLFQSLPGKHGRGKITVFPLVWVQQNEGHSFATFDDSRRALMLGEPLFRAGTSTHSIDEDKRTDPLGMRKESPPRCPQQTRLALAWRIQTSHAPGRRLPRVSPLATSA